MSPEQARGEGHRVDGRSDVFSLGVVFYELLVGQRPFRADSLMEQLEQINSFEPRPPRQFDDQIPKELDRICLKALSKRASERYSTAKDLADDLRHFLAEQPSLSTTEAGSREFSPIGQQLSTAGGTGTGVTPATATSEHRLIKIVPKGLRSFDSHDSDFFLELLPGPRDRDGLPDSIRFWKTRVEEKDADATFTVGLIYGPSGCGKSSLVKAGLLPRLSNDVIAVYVEATPEETETRLLHGLRKRCPVLEKNLSLKATLAALRRGHGIPVRKKVLIVLDQFEQWLHAKKEEENTELVQVLRQCDGARVQCIVMVRDDFWMAATRFMRDLEVRLLEGQNSAAVDLFPIRHAEKVLAAFGRAFGVLPGNSSETSNDQQQFLEQAVSGLAQEGKVICVRLALFAEMMKGKAWTPASLKAVGGTEGVGVSFLEETFSATTAPPQHRFHQKSAETILKSLLPETGSDIKGHMRSYGELLEVSGYATRPKDFDELIGILDGELRLITPTDPEGVAGDEAGVAGDAWRVAGGEGTPGKVSVRATHHAPPATRTATRYYQLTHDYLVHSLRDWLTRKQKETRRGRAELKLAERSGLWNARPENRHLPTLAEWLGIGTFTHRRGWTDPQRVMMTRAVRFHLSRLATATMIVALIAVAGLWTWHRVDQDRRAILAGKAQAQEVTRIEGLVGRLVSADPAQVPDIVNELDANPEVAATFLSPLVALEANTIDEKRKQLHARLATVGRDKSLVEPLLEELLNNKVVYIGPIRRQLQKYSSELTERLWTILRDENAESSRRFHAAVALADYVPASNADLWSNQVLQFVVRQLVSANAEFQPLLRENLRPIKGRLLADLETVFGDPKSAEAQRLSAANAFADYAGRDIPMLSQLLTVATREQFAVLYPIVAASVAPSTVEDLGKIAAKLPPPDLGSAARISFGQRRANAAVTLLRLGEREKVFSAFEMIDDPEALTQFVFRCRERGIGADALLDCLQKVSDAPRNRYPNHSRYALLLAIGEFSLNEIAASRRPALLRQLADWYRHDPSSGVHGAAGWLLRQWGQAEVALQVDQTPAPYAPDREWFTLEIKLTPTVLPIPAEKPAESKPAAGSPAKADEPDQPAELPKKTFYYTFIVFQPGDYDIGSVNDEPERQKSEDRRPITLTRPFALLDREISLDEVITLAPGFANYLQQFNAKPTDAAFGVHWYDCVGFCVWLGEQAGLSEEDQCYADPETLNKDEYPREPNPGAKWAPRNWPMNLDRRGFRLPTESEWEVASRGGARTSYGFGSEANLLGRFGWYQENGGKHAHPPRELRPSVRGLFDMHGNLFEWTHDWFADAGVGTLADPLGPKVGTTRVSRGGSIDGDAAGCRSARRNMLAPAIRTSYQGFRLAVCPTAVSVETKTVTQPKPLSGDTKDAPVEQRPKTP